MNDRERPHLYDGFETVGLLAAIVFVVSILILIAVALVIW
jgi:hypothetical protein